jgi:hypothetical protein
MIRTVAVDFDGVIHAYRQGWHDGTIYDKPMPGAFDALRTLMSTYAVFVHTTRDASQVAQWIEYHAAIPTVDDRAIRFESWDQALAELQRR